MTLSVSVFDRALLSTGRRMPSSQLLSFVLLLVGLQGCRLVTALGMRQVV